MSQTNPDLLDVIALDKVQKKQNIGDSELKSLKDKKLVEGRRPSLFVSSTVAAATQAKADYIRNRAFDKDHYEKMVVTYLEKFGEATRQDLDKNVPFALCFRLCFESLRGNCGEMGLPPVLRLSNFGAIGFVALRTAVQS